MTISQLSLLFQTSRHLSPHQIFYRLYFLVRRKCWLLAGKKAPSSAGCQLIDYYPLYLGLQDSGAPGPWMQQATEGLGRACARAQGRFRFLNVEVIYTEEINWHDPGVSRLWRYHLHYFDYIEDLLLWAVAGHDPLAWDAFRRLVKSWIEGNRKVIGDGWHPFTLSVRVVNWLQAFHFWKSRFKCDPEFSSRFVESLYGQIKVLASSLEYDVRGNHLIKNLRTLIWAGVAFGDNRWEKEMDRAIQVLEKELAEQVLGDGGHFERVPGYHAAVLKDCLEMGLCMRRNWEGGSPDWLDGTLQRMIHYLLSILLPDGNLPLLKDTARGVTPPPTDLLAAGALYFNNPEFKISESFGIYPLLLFGKEGWEIFRRWPSAGRKAHSATLPESGYTVMRDESTDDYLIFDGGKVCPDYLPAHAHADMFSYELMVKGQRIVVDSGIYEYTAGAWRKYFRSTRAHNTVEVEGQNQSEVWGSFRVARRARPFRVSWKAERSHILVQGKHDGYCRLPFPVVHRRILLWEKGRFWLVVDQLMPEYVDQRSWGEGRKGEGRFRADSHVHLHPKIDPEQVDSCQWRLNGLGFPLWIRGFGHGEVRITRGQIEPCIQGWYSTDFGGRVPNSVLSFHRESTLPFLFGYVISEEEHLIVDCNVNGTDEREVSIEAGKRVCRLCVDFDGVKYFS